MEYKGKLHETVVKFPMTDVWNDSCAKDELEYAIERGAVGATTNPVIVTQVLEKELPIWEDTIKKLIVDNPTASEDDIAWKLIETIGLARAPMLMPTFEKFKGLKGRLSMQTNAKYNRNWELMADQAAYFDSLAPNIQVKMPVTAAGVKAIEESTYRGVNVNATVSFILPQAIAVAEAVERGLARRRAEGLPTENMSPVCTLMVGRLDDYLKGYAPKMGIDVDPEAFKWAGVAVFKKAYQIYKARGYQTRVLVAAVRGPHHWSNFIGGDCVMTIPYGKQVEINESDIEVKARMDDPVDEKILAELNKIPEFVRAYAEDGVAVEDFVNYGSTRATLRGFLEGYDKLVRIIRDYMVLSLDVMP